MGLIRFLLALAVATVHITGTTIFQGVNSVLAVQCFYTISGFLIAGAWDEKYSKQPHSLALFYTNRAARIFFMYWTVLFIFVVIGVVFFVMAGRWPPYLIVIPAAPLTFLIFQITSNLTLIGSSVGLWLGSTLDAVLYFTSDFTASPFPVWRLLAIAPAWTLELELWFYLLAPFLLRLRLQWIAAIAALSFAARIGGYMMEYNSDPWTYRFFPFELGVFLLGAIAYKVTKSIEWSRFRWLSMLVFGITTASIAAFVPPILTENRYLFLVLFAAALPMIFNLTRTWRIDRLLADMSFPLYLVHWPILLLVYDLPKPFPSWPSMTPVLLSIISAAALALLVERPIDKWRHSRIQGIKSRTPQKVPQVQRAFQL